MTWGLVFGLAIGAYAFKVLGLVVVGDRPLPAALERCLALIPAAVIAAIVAKDTLSVGQHLEIDARLAGVSLAIVAAWRKMPVIVVILVGAATTAIVRRLAG
ncbi:MAG: AzlD protein [Ilumatobacteraceae bacterium]|nr:AzlD protein [Ilumatobacteraceae bacterium]